MDNNARIEPGIGAGGFTLGMTYSLNYEKQQKFMHSKTGEPVLLENIKLWIEEGFIKQIGLYGNYSGKINNKIGLGNTLLELRSEFGELIEDDEDNLVLKDYPGICFETEKWDGEPGSEQILNNLNKKITEIYLYPVTT